MEFYFIKVCILCPVIYAAWYTLCIDCATVGPGKNNGYHTEAATTEEVTTTSYTYSTPRTSVRCEFYQDQNHTCYHVLLRKRSWRKASKRCEEKGGHIVMPKEAWLHNFMKEILRKYQEKSMWMGVRREVGEWVWTDSTQLADITNWSLGEPVGTSGSENCAVVSTGDSFRWQAVSCTEKHNFMCQLKLKELYCKLAKSYYEPTSGRCFRPSKTKLTWKEASQYCQSRGAQGLLAIIDTVDIMNGLVTSTSWASPVMWIGLKRERWTWAKENNESSVVDSAYWGPTQPSNVTGGHCVKLQEYADGSYYWTNDDCDTQLHAVCQIETSKVLFVPTTEGMDETTVSFYTTGTTGADNPDASQQSDTGLSKGQAAGVAFGVIIVLLVAAVSVGFGWYYLNRIHSKKAGRPSLYGNIVIDPENNPDKENHFNLLRIFHRLGHKDKSQTQKGRNMEGSSQQLQQPAPNDETFTSSDVNPNGDNVDKEKRFNLLRIFHKLEDKYRSQKQKGWNTEGSSQQQQAPDIHPIGDNVRQERNGSQKQVIAKSSQLEKLTKDLDLHASHQFLSGIGGKSVPISKTDKQMGPPSINDGSNGKLMGSTGNQMGFTSNNMESPSKQIRSRSNQKELTSNQLGSQMGSTSKPISPNSNQMITTAKQIGSTGKQIGSTSREIGSKNKPRDSTSKQSGPPKNPKLPTNKQKKSTKQGSTYSQHRAGEQSSFGRALGQQTGGFKSSYFREAPASMRVGVSDGKITISGYQGESSDDIQTLPNN